MSASGVPYPALPVIPVDPWEWRPSSERSFGQRVGLPEDLDAKVNGYPLREVVGRLLLTGHRDPASLAVVGTYDGIVQTFHRADPAENELRAARALLVAGEAGCAFGRVTSPVTGGPPQEPREGDALRLEGLVFDLALSRDAHVFHSDVLVVGGVFLGVDLRLSRLPLGALESTAPGAHLVREMLAGGDWPLQEVSWM